jgi:hypothetical protein
MTAQSEEVYAICNSLHFEFWYSVAEWNGKLNLPRDTFFHIC